MVSGILKAISAKKSKSITFTNENLGEIDTDLNELGLYIHIPFCKVLCSFCPYYKIKYDKELAVRYKDALINEIYNIGQNYKSKKITSIYFGGGTPSLLIDYLEEILSSIKDIFEINCEIGIELHPRDVTRELLGKLKRIGFTMVSLGIKSFQEKNLEILGRDFINGSEVLRMVKDTGFKVIDIDFIFGIKGQTEEDLRKDFRIAFNNGATQISAYPCIDFSDETNKIKPMGKREKKKLLNCLEELSDELNLERTSVWTFGKKDTMKYSSITRDTYLGFGASTASLTKKYFALNTFSVEEYIKVVNEGENPKALKIDFTNGGADQYSLLEQHYTHKYIDKVWSHCKKTPWPEKIRL